MIKRGIENNSEIFMPFLCSSSNALMIYWLYIFKRSLFFLLRCILLSRFVACYTYIRDTVYLLFDYNFCRKFLHLINLLINQFIWTILLIKIVGIPFSWAKEIIYELVFVRQLCRNQQNCPICATFHFP